MSKETGKRKFNRLKLFHLNAQSLKNRDHLIQIRVIAQNVDILAISESWLNSSISNAEIEIQDYEKYRLDRKCTKSRGVCIYVRNKFKTKMLKDLTYISSSGFHQVWVQIQVKNTNHLLSVHLIYRQTPRYLALEMN